MVNMKLNNVSDSALEIDVRKTDGNIARYLIPAHSKMTLSLADESEVRQIKQRYSIWLNPPNNGTPVLVEGDVPNSRLYKMNSELLKENADKISGVVTSAKNKEEAINHDLGVKIETKEESLKKGK